MVASWPGKIPAGIRPEGMATMMDWLPTFAALTGASLPDDRPIDGKDISGVLMGHSEREDQELFYYMSGQLRAYRSGDWKLKLPYKGKVPALSLIHSGFIPSHDMLLFNLEDDPQEGNNLADQEVEIVTSMLEKMEIFKESLGELPAAKKTGKNMDFGPYIRLVTILLFKVFLVTVLTLTLVWLSIRYIRSRLKSKASEC
jgi:arylsulfatase